MTFSSRSASWFIAGALAATAIVGGVQIAAATSSSTIHGCAAKSNGALRVARHCTKHETAISWNSRGPKGNKGPAGTLNGFASEPGTGESIPAGNAYTVLSSIGVPASAAGYYIVTATAEITSTSGTGIVGNCKVATGDDATNVTDWETPGTTDIETVYPTMTAEILVPSGGATVTYECASGAAVNSGPASMSLVEVSNAPA